jgi:glycosyltransferase involved in cell wall biosynthesis
VSYWVAVVAKDAAELLPTTLISLLNQTLAPKRVIVVDDGSKDATPRILSEYERKRPSSVEVVSLPDRGYDIRRVPANINRAWNTARDFGLETDYFMISGDDCIYPTDYARRVIERMIDESLTVVASGQPSSHGQMSREHSPSGSGRMVKSSFWAEIGGGYPVKAGWETWLLYKAQEMGHRVELLREVTFEHVRPRGAKHQLTYWGAAMHGLGYHPLYAIGRIGKNVATRATGLRGSANMLRGYSQACLGSADPFISPFDSSLRKFVRYNQTRSIVKAAGSALRLQRVTL